MRGTKAIISVVVTVILLISIPLVVYLTRQQQEVRTRAQTNSTCQTPAQVPNVLIEYPYCSGGGSQCSFTQATCSWGTVSDAVSYHIKITEVDTGQVIRDASVNPSTTQTVFPVVSLRTYKCEVSAVNSCGATGPAGTHSFLCPAQATSPTATPLPTAIPTLAPLVIPTLIPTSTPFPTPTRFIPPVTLKPGNPISPIVGTLGISLVILGGAAFLMFGL